MRSQFLGTAVLVLLSFAGSAVAQDHAPMTKSYEDVRFAIWYMHWRHGSPPLAPYRHTGPTVVVFIGEGTLRLPSGEKKARHNGEVAYFEPGSVATAGELVTDAPLTATVIELKDAPPARAIPPQAYPPAFPRADATKILETPKVAVWSGLMRADQATQMHLHDKNSVTVYATDAVIRRAHPNQAPQEDKRPAGSWEMTHAGYIDYEQAVGVPAAYVAIVLK